MNKKNDGGNNFNIKDDTSYDLDPMLYHHLLGDDNNANRSQIVAAQRNCAVLSIEAASKSLDNASLCQFQTQKLNNLLEITNKDDQNIYDKLLQETYPNIKSRRQFTTQKNMPKIDLQKYLDPLECSADGQKLFCTKSEASCESEMIQFRDLVDNKTKSMCGKFGTLPVKNKINLEDRFEKLDRLQGLNQSASGFNQTNDFHLSSHRVKDVKVKKRQDEVVTFSTACEELKNQNSKVSLGSRQGSENEIDGSRKQVSRRNNKSKFISPLLSNREKSSDSLDTPLEKEPIPDGLKNIEPKMVELIKAEIMDQGTQIGWDDIAGLDLVKSAIQEAVVWPLLRPDIFTGLRRPPKGILLFGPPGTGKTLIGKCVAGQSKSTFFNISASSLTSKWIGDGEKMVRALFAVARTHQPAVIFIDEVDSLLTQRSDTEHESSRRIKTEFLVQLDGATTDSEERLLLIGATNRPQELDEAARRRFVKRLYIPLPDYEARLNLLKRLISSERHSLTETQFREVAELSAGYSGADIKNLCSEAALGPIRALCFGNIENIQASQVRPLEMADFANSLRRVKPSVSQDDLVHYISWNKTYGSCGLG